MERWKWETIDGEAWKETQILNCTTSSEDVACGAKASSRPPLEVIAPQFVPVKPPVYI